MKRPFLGYDWTEVIVPFFNRPIKTTSVDDALLFLSKTPDRANVEQICFYGKSSSPELLKPCLENQVRIFLLFYCSLKVFLVTTNNEIL
jgi:hypothetical protein